MTNDEEHVERIEMADSDWRAMLTPEQYEVLREGATEPPFSAVLDDVDQPGTYVCAGCRAELFDSDARYESDSGWPAFSAPGSAARTPAVHIRSVNRSTPG